MAVKETDTGTDTEVNGHETEGQTEKHTYASKLRVNVLISFPAHISCLFSMLLLRFNGFYYQMWS